jgi:hypothetical protein
MRNLLYIPMIHVDSDLGSIAASVNRISLEICGKERWLRHKEVVTAFWDRLRDYFNRMDPHGLEIYQDGLMAGGELGLRIIEEGARKGSPNHQIVLDLITRGARIRKTEDAELLKREFHRILELAGTGPELEESIAIQHRTEGERLMAERDRFIAKTINQTLKEGERGALFIGAFHNVLPDLEDDIEIRELKCSNKVKEYFEAVISSADDETFDRLARYMVSDLETGSEVQGPKSNEGQIDNRQ